MSSRHVIEVSYPRVTNRQLWVVLNIRDWNPRLGFYYPASSIDNLEVRGHVTWKFAGDINWLLMLSAEMDIEQTDPDKLNLHNWAFNETARDSWQNP